MADSTGFTGSQERNPALVLTYFAQSHHWESDILCLSSPLRLRPFKSQSRNWDSDIMGLGLSFIIYTQAFSDCGWLSKACMWIYYEPTYQAIVKDHTEFSSWHVDYPHPTNQKEAEISKRLDGIAQSQHWESDFFSLGLIIETQTFSVSVLSLRLKHFQSQFRSAWSDLANPCHLQSKFAFKRKYYQL